MQKIRLTCEFRLGATTSLQTSWLFLTRDLTRLLKNRIAGCGDRVVSADQVAI